MPMGDGFDPDHPLPRFLADRAEPQGIPIATGRAVISSRVSKVSILIAAATATAIAVLLVRDPVTLFAAVKASLVGNSALQPGTAWPESTIQSTAEIQSTADVPAAIRPTADAPAPIQSITDAPAAIRPTAEAQALPPNAKDAPPPDEFAASEPAAKDQVDESEPSHEALFRQFQAWVAQQDTQANVKPVQPAQDAPAQVARITSAQVAQKPAAHRLVQKRRHVLPVPNARGEVRTQNLRKKVQPTQRPRVAHPPIQNAQVQSQAVQNAQAPLFPSILGPRN